MKFRLGFILVLLLGFAPEVQADNWLTRFVKEKSSQMIKDLAKGYGVEMNWDDVKLGFKPLGLTRYEITVGTTNTCIKAADFGLDVCYSEFTAQLLLDINPAQPRLEEISQLVLIGGRLKLRPKLPAQPEEEPFLELPDFSQSVLPAGLVDTRIGKIKLQLEEWNIGSGTEPSRGKVQIESRHYGKVTKLTGDITILGESGPASQIGLQAETKGGLGGQWTIKAKVDQRSEGSHLKVDVTTVVGSKSANRIQGKVLLNQGALKVATDLRLQLMGRKLSGTVETSVVDGKGAYELTTSCRSEVSWGELTAVKQFIDAAGDCKVNPKLGVAGLEVSQSQLNFRLYTENGRATNPQFELTSKLLVDASFREESLKVDVSNKIRLKPKSSLDNWQQRTSVTVGSQLPGARDSALIPAPFAEMSGPIRLTIADKGWQSFGNMALQAQLSTNLKSQYQSLITEHIYDLKVHKDKELWRIDLNGSSVMEDVLLYLPDVRAEQPPQLLVDSRVVMTPPEEAEADASSPETAEDGQKTLEITYNVQVKTGRKPLRLHSNLAKDVIPISIDTRLNANGIKGSVKVARSEIEVFRREAVLEHFHLKFTDAIEIGKLDGRINVPYSAYLVHIDVKGTAAAPEVYLTSEPPLPEDKLYAVLVFGRPLDELGDGEMQSVHNVQAAATEGAMTLASMYYLASTPVESVTYNPESKVFSARIRLASGTSVDVGSDMAEHRRVGLRQRITSSWSVNTYVEDGVETDGPSATSFLEWAKRF